MGQLSKKLPVASGSDTALRSSAYGAIKQMILAGSLRPGRKLVHDELATALGVSRTPVREALERLQQEGFLTYIPRRGCFVSEITADEARELYGVREALEVYALRQTAALGLTRDNIVALEAVLETYATLVRDNVMRQRLQVDRDFHLALAAIPGNRALSSILESVYERIFLKIRTEGFRTPTGAEGYKEHVQLLRMLKAGDFPGAEKMLAMHITQGRDRLLSHIEDSAHGSAGVLPLKRR
jgi:GntR family transcriptional regulator, rspAB operon transcriptional repressor